jgi:hypothetical protein
VDSYLSALLGAGLSSEHFKAAAEQKEVSEDDADANIAAKYYVNQILNLDEASIQHAWLKVGTAAHSTVPMQVGSTSVTDASLPYTQRNPVHSGICRCHTSPM